MEFVRRNWKVQRLKPERRILSESIFPDLHSEWNSSMQTQDLGSIPVFLSFVYTLSDWLHQCRVLFDGPLISSLGQVAQPGDPQPGSRHNIYQAAINCTWESLQIWVTPEDSEWNELLYYVTAFHYDTIKPNCCS